MDHITLTMAERRSFHSMDRNLYMLLVRDLCRNPTECLQIMAFWLWLERGCGKNIILQILPMQMVMVSKLADEAMACLVCVRDQSPVAFAVALLPLTLDIFKRCLCKQFFFNNWRTAYVEVQKVVREVCIPTFSDLCEQACRGGFHESASQAEMAVPVRPATSLPQNQLLQAPPAPHNSSVQRSSANTGRDMSPATSGSRQRPGRRNTTTVFITFSKGYPVSESEVSAFCTRLSRNRVQSIKMQPVTRQGQQPLYAKVVFWSPSVIDEIVAGGNKAKFSINGKHIWMREFEPNERAFA